MKNLLYIDDSADDVFLFESACRRAKVSFGFRSVKDGEKAIAYLAGEGIYADRECYPVPDLILLDLKMPFRSGYEVLAWIRSQPRLKQLPVIIFTGGIRDSDAEHVCQLGADEFLAKTGELDELMKIALALESVLAHAHFSLKPLRSLRSYKTGS